MGTICVPSYAKIFTAHFEQKFIYPLLAVKHHVFSIRYHFNMDKSGTRPIGFLNDLNI